jgi:hypothetical protein
LILEIDRVLKQFVVLPEDVLPVWERLPRVWIRHLTFIPLPVRGGEDGWNFNLADAALVDAIHKSVEGGWLMV